ncbi:CP4-44 prophage; predicted disrupted hemin or colicin receptor [Escherichia coli]|nr:CP4-44 prophage; predicted disrupted hemin or colicin receptor [Escherichia coli]
MNITLRQIKYFVSTAESGSLSTAAKSLNISQSAITTAIQGLERDIGYKLLIRSKSGVDLTDEGRLFLYNAWICPYISRHLLSLNPLLACCRRYSRGER